MRLGGGDQPAVHLFAWGRASFGSAPGPRRFPARQTREASEAIARLHELAPDRVLLVQQHPEGIDGGAFHTDVLAVGAGRFLMMHQRAFVDSAGVTAWLRSLIGPSLTVELASDDELPLADAVASYAFNSQLVGLDDGSTTILAPEESRENPRARAFLERVLRSDNPVRAVEYLALRQSMQNGGGPACLRLRVPLSEAEVGAMGARVLFSDTLDQELVSWVGRHYRDRSAACPFARSVGWRARASPRSTSSPEFSTWARSTTFSVSMTACASALWWKTAVAKWVSAGRWSDRERAPTLVE